MTTFKRYQCTRSVFSTKQIKMISRFLLMMSFVGLACSCTSKKDDISQKTADSLRVELLENRKLTVDMMEIGSLLDSIDANRGELRVRMMEGATYETYAERMRNLNQYVRAAEEKIAALEKASRKDKDNAATYAGTIQKLKSDLEVRNRELTALKEQVETYKNQNENLISTVGLQKAEIDDKLNQIKSKQDEIDKLQDQVNQLMVKSTLDQGEAYFARGAAVEEIAKRTHFAPRKKKKSQKEAIELYKLALNFGKDEAQTRIAALEKKM